MKLAIILIPFLELVNKLRYNVCMDQKIQAFKRLMARAERAVHKAGLSPQTMTNKQLQKALIDAKVMDKDRQFLDEAGHVIIV